MTIKQALLPLVLLLGLNGWLVYENLRIWTAPATPAIALDRTPAPPPSTDRESSDTVTRLRPRTSARSEFAVVVAKNLFHPDRRPIAQEEEKEEETQLGDASDYVLHGTMILDNGERLAYLSKKSESAMKRVYLSETFDGYRVVQIEPTKVRLRKGSEELVVECFRRPEGPGRAPRRASASRSKSRRDYLRERRLQRARERARERARDRR